MKKHGLLKTILIIILIIILFGGGALLAYYFINGGRNPFEDIIDNLNNDRKLRDTYNGIYVYTEELNGTKYIYEGCSVSELSYYVLVVNDDYYSFKSSCMGTYPIEEGKIDKLEIKENAAKNNYILVYNDHEYEKNDSINTIETNNAIAKRLKEIDLTSYELILNETEFEGNYYTISAKVNNITSKLLFGFKKLDDNTFDITINDGIRGSNKEFYKYNMKDYSVLPVFYTFGRVLVVVEPLYSNNKATYKFKAISENGVIYELDKMFPIVVDGVSLTTDNSIYVKYNQTERNFTLLVGYNDKFCVKDSDSTNKAYYEFKIDYDYLSNNFKMPEFIKYGLENEGCGYVERLMGGN